MRRQAVPEVHRANFWYLYLDIIGFGVLAGTSLSFVAVFAARQGASALEVGLLNAAPAAISLLLTLPAGRWVAARPLGAVTFWSSVFYRFWYLSWALVPCFLAPHGQVWAIILSTLVMSLMGPVLSIGFNAFYAAVVPPEWRSLVTGTRNALYAITVVISSLVAGQILEHLPFPLGYQVVFALGFLGAAYSSWQLARIRVQGEPRLVLRSVRELAQPACAACPAPRTAVGQQIFRRLGTLSLERGLWTYPFAMVLLGLFAFHFAQYAVTPIIPLYLVRVLNLNDQTISYGTALQQLTLALASTQVSRLERRLRHQGLTVSGSVLLGLYPALLALSHTVGFYLAASAFGGVAWALVGGGLGNYLLECIPEDRRPTYLAWYNLALNAAILLGSLVGPLLVKGIDLVPALWVSTGLFVLAGGLIALERNHRQSVLQEG